ncbi:PilZ domain-containing protein [Rhodopseudomonas sp. HC1]|uniref:PilZ domain-containing protein n=1 Tax=Rhodopseudomonas infernalis TaxID=2897386 RepID=UPI001EE8B229|nr:PilZ domain-containing protein [Rhodopseudomonas infernalis]MCG6203476.1 PilZ domain-containing protein [Rhodopseudomonas infernalis]
MSIPEKRKSPRIAFDRGFDAWIMSIDGTWRLSCKMRDASAEGARLVPSSIEKLKEKEFFLLLSSTGLAYRRCELAWINGEEIGVKFLQVKR